MLTPAEVETALQYLERDPWEFRSGYAKATLLRRLTHAALGEGDRERLRRVLVRYVEVGPRWDFREACTAARAHGGPALAADLRRLLHGPDPAVAHRALVMQLRLRRPRLTAADLERGRALLLHQATRPGRLELATAGRIHRLWSPTWGRELVALAEDRSSPMSVPARRLLREVPRLAERARAGP